MKYQFSNYAHDNYTSGETVEMLMGHGWSEAHAAKYVEGHSPMYEVKGEFEYDTETDELKVIAAVINGVRLTP
jgi:hypothetical protein